MVIRDVRPRGQSSTDTNNGPMHLGTQHHRGQDWGRQCGDCFEHSLIAAAPRALLARLRVARMAWRGIGRALGGTRTWLFGVLVQGIKAWPDPLHVPLLTGHGDVMRPRLAVAAAERSRVIRRKAHKPWSWIAMAAAPRHVLALPVGARSRKRAQRRWANIPQADRQPAPFDTEPSVV
jgi:hypothetical protein